MRVVFSATLSRLLPLQLESERFQYIRLKLNIVCKDQSKPSTVRP